MGHVVRCYFGYESGYERGQSTGKFSHYIHIGDEKGVPIACMGKTRNVYQVLICKREGKIPNKMGGDSIKVDLEEIGEEKVGAIHQDLDKEQMAGSCGHRNYPSSCKKPGDFLII